MTEQAVVSKVQIDGSGYQVVGSNEEEVVIETTDLERDPSGSTKISRTIPFECLVEVTGQPGVYKYQPMKIVVNGQYRLRKGPSIRAMVLKIEKGGVQEKIVVSSEGGSITVTRSEFEILFESL